MAEFPALNFYTDAFIADTSHLDALETGAYAMLLFVAWRIPDGRLPNDDRILARYARCTKSQWKRVKVAVLAFWSVDESGNFFQKRLEVERAKARRKSEIARANAKRKSLTDNEVPEADDYTDASIPLEQNASKNAATTSTSTSTVKNTPPTPPKGGRRAKVSFMRPDWQPDEGAAAFAKSIGIDPIPAAAEFRDYWIGAGKPMADWQATFRNRCRQLATNGWRPPPPKPKREGFQI